MNLRLLFTAGLGLLLGLPATVQAARVISDLQPPQKRQATVALAEKLAQRMTPPALPEDLVSPFNPTQFNKPDPSETPAVAPVAGPAVPDAPPPVLGDREILEAVAMQLTPTGTINYEGSPLLVMGSKRFEAGTRFTVTYNGEDYDLELVAIDRTTFTLRYKGEVFTRPIRSVR